MFPMDSLPHVLSPESLKFSHPTRLPFTSVAFFSDLSTPVALFFMSAKARRGGRDWRDDHPLRRKDVQFRPSCQGRVVNGNDDHNVRDSRTPSLFRPRPSRNPIAAPVTLTDYVEKFSSFSHVRLLAAMHQVGDRLDCIDASFGARHDTAFEVWMKK